MKCFGNFFGYVLGKRFGAQSLLLIATLLALPLHAEVVNVSGDEFQKLIEQGVPVIDVRRPDEWKKTGIVKNSHLLTFFDKKGRYDAKVWLQELDKIVGKGDPFVLICAVGGRTGTITDFLDKQLGYQGVHNVQGGILQWIDQGRAVVAVSE